MGIPRQSFSSPLSPYHLLSVLLIPSQSFSSSLSPSHPLSVLLIPSQSFSSPLSPSHLDTLTVLPHPSNKCQCMFQHCCKIPPLVLLSTFPCTGVGPAEQDSRPPY